MSKELKADEVRELIKSELVNKYIPEIQNEIDRLTARLVAKHKRAEIAKRRERLNALPAELVLKHGGGAHTDAELTTLEILAKVHEIADMLDERMTFTTAKAQELADRLELMNYSRRNGRCYYA